MVNADLRPAIGLALDPTPDSRGQLMLAAILAGGPMVALPLSAN